MNLKTFLTAVVCILCALPTMAQEEVVTNETILYMIGKGYSTEFIINHVNNASDRQIKADLMSLDALKDAGADEELLSFVSSVNKVDNGMEGGIYWVNNGTSKPTKLLKTHFDVEKSGISGKVLGFGAAVAGTITGIGSGSLTQIAVSQAGGLLLASTEVETKKLCLPGKTSSIVLGGENASNPVFRFYFPKVSNNSFQAEGAGFADSYGAFIGSIESPHDFQCIKLEEKKDKRKFPNGGKYTVAGFSTSNNSAKNVVDFEITTTNNNTFEVTFPNGLEPGEYMFLYKNGMSNSYFQSNPFGFDFSIQ